MQFPRGSFYAIRDRSGSDASGLQSTPSLTSGSVSVDSAETPATTIDTPPRSVTPSAVEETISEPFDWDMDASLRETAFGEGCLFDGPYDDPEGFDDIDIDLATSSPYAAFGVHYPLQSAYAQESVYYANQHDEDNQEAMDVDFSDKDISGDHYECLSTDLLR